MESKAKEVLKQIMKKTGITSEQIKSEIKTEFNKISDSVPEDKRKAIAMNKVINAHRKELSSKGSREPIAILGSMGALNMVAKKIRVAKAEFEKDPKNAVKRGITDSKGNPVNYCKKDQFGKMKSWMVKQRFEENENGRYTDAKGNKWAGKIIEETGCYKDVNTKETVGYNKEKLANGEIEYIKRDSNWSNMVIAAYLTEKEGKVHYDPVIMRVRGENTKVELPMNQLVTAMFFKREGTTESGMLQFNDSGTLNFLPYKRKITDKEMTHIYEKVFKKTKMQLGELEEWASEHTGFGEFCTCFLTVNEIVPIETKNNSQMINVVDETLSLEDSEGNVSSGITAFVNEKVSKNIPPENSECYVIGSPSSTDKGSLLSIWGLYVPKYVRDMNGIKDTPEPATNNTIPKEAPVENTPKEPEPEKSPEVKKAVKEQAKKDSEEPSVGSIAEVDKRAEEESLGEDEEDDDFDEDDEDF